MCVRRRKINGRCGDRTTGCASFILPLRETGRASTAVAQRGTQAHNKRVTGMSGVARGRLAAVYRERRLFTRRTRCYFALLSLYWVPFSCTCVLSFVCLSPRHCLADPYAAAQQSFLHALWLLMYQMTASVRRALYTYFFRPRPNSPAAFFGGGACSKHSLDTRGVVAERHKRASTP